MEERITELIRLLHQRSIEDYEIFAQSTDSIRAEAKDGTAGSLVRAAETGLGLRILMRGSMGFSYAAEPTGSLVDAALNSARHQFSDEHYILPQGGAINAGEMPVFDESIAALESDACIELACRLETAARQADPRIVKVRKANFSRSFSRVRIVNSRGIDVGGQTCSAAASIMVMARQGDDQQSGYDSDFSHVLADLDPERVGQQAARAACGMLNARPAATMCIPVLFDPRCTAQLLGFISSAFSGENVIKNTSCLKDRLDEMCFSTNISLTDDPLHPRAAGGLMFDGEGVPSRSTVLVEQGRLEAFIYDTYWGRLAGRPSTGNALRGSWRSRPALGMRHLRLHPEAGGYRHELEGLKQILQITDIMGMHTGDPISGELSVGVSGYLMDKGDILYPVREAALSANVYDMLSRVHATGDDERAFGGVMCPSILVDSVNISSR